MKLSIIIPYYNTQDYTDELLNVLDKQITDDVEVILVDDGSPKTYKTDYEWVRIIRQSNGGPAKARNKGIEKAKGEYIQFIDSDDLVSEDFVSEILKRTNENPDIIEFSWRSLNSSIFMQPVSATTRNPFPGCVLRTFKRSYIGNIRFNEQKDATEDEDFSRRLGYLWHDNRVSISKYLYFYRNEVEGSNVKQFKQGLKNTKRIVYYYKEVTADRTDILEAIKKDDEQNEVVLLTERCELPELKRWCQILRPCKTWTHYQKGEPYNLVIIPVPIEAKVIVFIRSLHVIGGIETFLYHFAQLIDFTLVVANISPEQRERIGRFAKIVDWDINGSYKCDTLIMLRILDKFPHNIMYKKSVQMCHGCKTNSNWHITQMADHIVNVSEASKVSFGQEAEHAQVIHNPIIRTDKKALVLVSATRIPAPDKGQNEKRMRILAEMLNEERIPFIWFNFSEGQIPNPPRGMVNMSKEMDIQPYIAAATYLVQLSDSEAWSYSILEALVNETPVIVTDFPSAHEMGIKDGENGYILPFSMDFDVKRLLNVPKFTFSYDNEVIKAQWHKIINGPKPKISGVRLRIIQAYNDTQLGRLVNVGEVIKVSKERAKQIIDCGFGKEY